MRIYLDNSATTRIDPRVVAAMDSARDGVFANASSVHRDGQQARVRLEEARETIAAPLGAELREIVLTSGGTEANNLALKGVALSRFLGNGSWPTIVTAPTEHHAVLHPVEFLARMGAPVRFVTVDEQGRVAPDALRDLLSSLDGSAGILVSIMHANNETGVLNPVAELAEVVHAAGGLLHTDAVQSFGKLSFTARSLGVDLLSTSAHKLHGPKGIGALYVNRAVELEPLLHGGGQERNRRGGTEATLSAIGFAAAVSMAVESLEENSVAISRMRDALRARLESIDGLRCITPTERVVPNVLSVTFDDAERLDGAGLIVGMDLEGVAVSNGSACTSGSIQPSHVLAAMGLREAQAKAAVRFSLSRMTTEAELEFASAALARVVGRMRDRVSQRNESLHP